MRLLGRYQALLLGSFFCPFLSCAFPTEPDPPVTSSGSPPAQFVEPPHPVNTTGFLFPYAFDGQIGFIDQRGTMIVEPLFDQAGSDFVEGRIQVQTTENGWGYLDDQGKLAIPLRYKDAQSFSEGLAAVQIASGLWGYIDKAGQVVIPPRFKDAGDFHEGLAFISLDLPEPTTEHGIAPHGTFGYIDKAGQTVIAPRFASAHDFHEGRAGVRIGDHWGFVDAKGNVAVEPKYEQVGSYSEQRAMVVPKAGQFGFIDLRGHMILGPHLGQAQDFSEGVAAIRLEGNKPLGAIKAAARGYLDLAGGFHELGGRSVMEPFSEGMAVVCEDGTDCEFIDHSYKHVIEADFPAMASFHNGLARVVFGGRDNGYINRKGAIVWRSQMKK